MKKRNIIITIVATALVFALASQLEGDGSYLRKLSATNMMRNAISSAADSLEDNGIASTKLQFNGEEKYLNLFNQLFTQSGKITLDQRSKSNLAVTFTDMENRLSIETHITSDGEEIELSSNSKPIGNWTSLLPPLFAIILAICLRKTLLSLSLAIWLGAMLNYSWNPFKAAYYGATKYIWGNFIGEFSLLILGFVFILVGMVNIINRGGGMAGVVNQITKIAKSARTACVSASCLGTAIFFDDYTNAIVVGTTMRSFTDKMRVSREKLSYIVDSTTAPLAGLALISTWIGFEVDQIHKVSEFLGISTSGYALFLQAIPFRFYCIFTIIFVFMVSIMRRDFGPMLKAERRAFLKGEVSEPTTHPKIDKLLEVTNVKPGTPERWYNAGIPVFSVIAFVLGGILYRGSTLIREAGMTFNITSLASWQESFMRIGGDGNSLFLIMFMAACFGSLIASTLVLSQKILSPKEIALAWIGGWKILPAAAILVLAWSIRQVCDDLGTALFLSSLVKDSFDPIFIPLVIFLLSAGVAFATGTSFGTMGLLLPTVAPLAYTLGNPVIFVMSLGAVLDGAIFGDHCSPISDTTILSSMASSCNHIDHVRTQMPYAIICMIVAALFGYLPAAMGVGSIYLYPIGVALLAAFLLIVGRSPEREPETIALKTAATIS
ncbi:MAG: Na+/H+ antiporter NhaC family protein [Pseudomonadota bacterium]